MKRIIFLISFLLPYNVFGQSIGRLPYQTVQQSYRGDTVKTKLGTDNVEFSTSLDGYSFNKSLTVQDTGLIDLIKTHGGGTAEETIPNQYFSDYSSDFIKKCSAVWSTAIATSRTWTGVAVSETGQYRTVVAFGAQIYVSSNYGVTWNPKATLGDWERVSMSGDGKYQAAIYYVSANDGYVYVSSDYGETWIQKSPFGQYEGVWVSYTGQYMYGGAGTSHAFYISTDYGNTWTDRTPEGVTLGKWTEGAISANGKYMVVCDGDGYIYTSSNGGTSWDFHQIGTLGSWFGATISYTGQYMAVTSTADQYIYTSNDYGETWIQRVNSNTTPKTGITMSLSGKYIMACSGGSPVTYSTDYGVNWIGASQSLIIRKVAISGNGTYATAVATGGYVYNSVPQSANITSLTLSLPATFGAVTVNYFQGDTAADPDYVRARVAAFPEQDPVMKSDITRTIFENWTTVGSSGQWKAVSVSKNTGQYQVACILGGYVYVSDDYGATWASRTAAGVKDWYSVAISDDGKYMTAVPQSSGNIWTSDDYGTTWTSRTTAQTWYGVSMSGTGQYQTAVVYGGYIFNSDDYGVTWEQKGLSGNYYGVAVSQSGQYQTAIRMSGQIFYSNDYGETWTGTGTSQPHGSVTMSSTGQYQYIALSGGGILKSINYGVTFTTVNATSRSYTAIDVSGDGSLVFATVSTGYIYFSNNYGVTFVQKHISAGWRTISMTRAGNKVTAGRFSGTLYTSVLTYDFNYFPSISKWATQPESDEMVATKGFVKKSAGTSQLTGSLTDSAPTASEITIITGISATAAGSGYRRYIKDSDGTGFVYLIYSDGSNYFFQVLSQTL